MTALSERLRRAKHSRLAEQRRFLIGKKMPRPLPRGLSHLSGRKMIHEAMVESPDVNSCWIVSDRKSIEDLLAVAVQLRAWLGARRRRLGNVALLEMPPLSSLAPAEAMFTRVAWADSWLPIPQLMEVLAAPNRQYLIIGGTVDPLTQTLTVYRGDFGQVTVPLSVFKPSGDGTVPDFDHFSIGEFGHSVCFGSYQSSADAIFYEGVPAYRKELKARRREKDKTFGASLRRLRMQRGLHQNDFTPIAARTIARIENNQVGKPHDETLSIIARRLDVDPAAIETY